MRNTFLNSHFHPGPFADLLADDNGQAVVEYVLMLATIIAGVTIISISFKQTIRNMWVAIGRKVAAGCPTGCQGPDTIR